MPEHDCAHRWKAESDGAGIAAARSFDTKERLEHLLLQRLGDGASSRNARARSIHIWHCNRDGEYSLYGADIQDENYLRGVPVSDSGGSVTFATIFPACYFRRYPHIHVEVNESLAVATRGSNALLITQLAMPRDIASTVYDTASGYSASVSNPAADTTTSDLEFETSSTAQLSAQTPALSGNITDGYSATVTVGVKARTRRNRGPWRRRTAAAA